MVQHEMKVHASARLTALTHARDCGKALNLAKGYVGHGEWEDWLDDNCQFSAGQARRYMRIAFNWPELSKRARATDLNLEDLSMRAAIRVLAKVEMGDTSPKEKAWRSIFVDMNCPSCGSKLVKTTAGIYVTCPECWACRLYPNPERRGQAEKAPPIVLAFQQWQKMPTDDRDYFLKQVTANRSPQVCTGADLSRRRLVDVQAELFRELPQPQ